MRVISNKIIISLLFFQSVAMSICFGQSNRELFLSIDFDQIKGNQVFEGCSQKYFPINGNYQITEAVLGNGLKSDGFTTNIIASGLDWRRTFNDFSISSWVSMETYGWNDIAVLDGRNKDNLDWGFYLGVTSSGYPIFSLAIEGSWKTLIASEKIDLYKWAFITATYDHTQGMSLYLNGEKVGTNNYVGFPSFNNFTKIARNSYDMNPDHVHRPYGAFPSKYSFDGIIDEIKGYKYILSEKEIQELYASAKPAKDPDFKQRYLPKGPEELPNEFSAYISALSYYPEYDAVWKGEAPEDIVVTFKDIPFRIVAWRGIRSAPCMVMKNTTIDNDIWVADQSAEYFAGKQRPGNTHGCAEHMSDAQCRYSRVRLIENTPARKVIHWRYFPTDVQYKLPYFDELTGWPTVIDEYYYIYPDGVYTRGYHSFDDESSPVDQYQETTIVNPSRTYPDDNVEREAITLADHQGNEISYLLKENFNRVTFPGLEKPNIQLLNIKADYKPFIIMDPDAVDIRLYQWNTGINSYFPMWNHFPVSQQAPSDGRQSVYDDRTSSSAFTWMKFTKPYKKDNHKNIYVYLTGATSGKASELARLSKSWNNAPEFILQSEGAESLGYEKFERAYIFNAEDNCRRIEGKFEVSQERPVHNLALRIENWGERDINVKINGKSLSASSYAFGFNKKLEGTTLLVFINKISDKPFTLKIESK